MTIVGGRPARPQLRSVAGELTAKRTAPATGARAARVAFLRESVARLQRESRAKDEIATILGISRFAVRAFDRDINTPQPRPAPEAASSKPPGMPALRAHIEKLWAEGHSTAEIARRCGTTKNSVVGHANRMGLPARPSPIKRHNPANPPPPLKPLTGPRAPKLVQLLPDGGAATPAAEQAAMPPPKSPFIGSRPGLGARSLAAALQAAADAAPSPARGRPPNTPDLVRPAAVPLSSRQGCQFPMWPHNTRAPRPPKFCDARRREGSSYCATHHAKCHERTPAYRH